MDSDADSVDEELRRHYQDMAEAKAVTEASKKQVAESRASRGLSTYSDAAADDMDIDDDMDDDAFIAEIKAESASAKEAMDEAIRAGGEMATKIKEIQASLDKFVEEPPATFGVPRDQYAKVDSGRSIPFAKRDSYCGYEHNRMGIGNEFRVFAIAEYACNQLGGFDEPKKLTDKLREEIYDSIWLEFGATHFGKGKLPPSCIEGIIDYVYNHHVLRAVPIESPNCFPRFGYNKECAMSFEEVIAFITEGWYLKDDNFPEGFCCPASSLFGFRTNTKLGAVSRFISYARASVTVLPEEWSAQLDSLNFQYNVLEGKETFEMKLGAPKGSMLKSYSYLAPTGQNRANVHDLDLRFVEYSNGTLTIDRERYRQPDIPDINSPHFFSNKQKQVLRHTWEAFLIQMDGIVFTLPKGDRYAGILPEEKQKPWYFDYKIEHDCVACTNGAGYCSLADARIKEIHEVVTRASRGGGIPVPSLMSFRVFESEKINFRSLCIKAHRDETFPNDNLYCTEAEARKQQWELVNAYKLLHEKCPCCGVRFDPDKLYHADLHHPGENKGIRLQSSGELVVGPKVENIANMCKYSRRRFLAFFLDELVKTVPICCHCHKILTFYLDYDYAAENGSVGKTVERLNVPFLDEEVVKPDAMNYV
mmetsp:Transcript_36586/g.79682  ORF Transcript_36586/g.79682 Transcript_36586/m.79682 type:complete len:647 (-) Transcript_36586:1356-3296(-)